MKFLGRTKDGYLVEVSDADVAALIGEHWLNSDGATKRLNELGLIDSYGRANLVGATVPLAERFRRVTAIEYQHKKLASSAETLRGLATLLDAVAASPIGGEKP